uniref:Uncharacterized protein n=1 Tax=viral metagenome TaxID=1070528 RepID=A0A6C0ISC7_9ZZZZ
MNINNILNDNIDDEWSLFMSKSNSETGSFGSNFVNFNATNNKYTNSSDDESSSEEDETNTKFDKSCAKKNKFNKEEPSLLNLTLPDEAPKPTEIYVSTKSKIAYLNQPINLKVFWEIPVIPYYMPQDGIIKKQMKFNSKSKEETDEILAKLEDVPYYEETIMSHIDNPNGRIKFKDIRKVSIGLSKKDIMSYRSKKKQAFYNCFVVILRLKFGNDFKEFHVKVFNTGQLEIPGIQNDEMFEKVLVYIMDLLKPFHPNLSYKDKSDTVLINSNFNCGFYINREVLYELLKYKYGLQSIYDPCSYPGIQSKFYYNSDLEIQDGKQITSENKEKYKNVLEVSFMIFRTGSVLIVGKCDVDILVKVYDFLTNIFRTEFKSICQRLIVASDKVNKQKNKKIRKKIIHNYYEHPLHPILELNEFQPITNNIVDEIKDEHTKANTKKQNKKSKTKIFKEEVEFVLE